MNKVILSFMTVFAVISFGGDASAQVNLISKRPEYGHSVGENSKDPAVIRLYCREPIFDRKYYENTVRIIYKNNIYYPKDFEAICPKKENISSLQLEKDSTIIAAYTMNPKVKFIFFVDSK